MQLLSDGVVRAGTPKFDAGSNVSVPVARVAAVSTPSATVYVRVNGASKPAGRVTVMQLSLTVIVWFGRLADALTSCVGREPVVTRLFATTLKVYVGVAPPGVRNARP